MKFFLPPVKLCHLHIRGFARTATMCNFLLVIKSNFGRISCSFRNIDKFSYKIACFLTLPSF